MNKLWSKLKLNIISIIIFILAIILAYNIYTLMNTKINGIEMFYFETTKETYEQLKKEYEDNDLKNSINNDKETYETLKLDYNEFINEEEMIESSECLKRKLLDEDDEITNEVSL